MCLGLFELVIRKHRQLAVRERSPVGQHIDPEVLCGDDDILRHGAGFGRRLAARQRLPFGVPAGERLVDQRLRLRVGPVQRMAHLAKKSEHIAMMQDRRGQEGGEHRRRNIPAQSEDVELSVRARVQERPDATLLGRGSSQCGPDERADLIGPQRRAV
jgi:hypothetical protein